MKASKYLCIRECCAADLSTLTIKTIFVAGRVYELTGKPNKLYFRKLNRTDKQD